MKYDHDISWVKKVLQSADIMNTFNGGTAVPRTKLEKNEDHYILKVRIPGVHAQRLGVEIVNSNLLIYHNVNFEAENNNIAVPHVVTNFPLSTAIDFRNISASYQDGALNVFMPLNELKSGYNKNIDIQW